MGQLTPLCNSVNSVNSCETRGGAKMIVLDLLFPPPCVGCGRGGHWLCPACVAAIAPAPARQDRLAPLADLWVVGVYADPLKRAIDRFKFKGQRRLAEPLGRLLIVTYRRQTQARPGAVPDVIVPVPLFPSHQAERGYNQSALLARVLGRGVGLPVIDGPLRRIRDTPQQARLNAEQRKRNVVDAFSCQPRHPALVGRSILLIDDVCTTGATLVECAGALLAGGAKEVRALVLARPAR